MSQHNGTKIKNSVYAKLLVVLVVLSLPLLIVSFIQLNDYRHSLNEQAATIARIEAEAGTVALRAWLEDNRGSVQTRGNLSQEMLRDLYERLRQANSLVPESVISVTTAQGQITQNPFAPAVLHQQNSPDKLLRGELQTWSDGVSRITYSKYLDNFGWTVTVGVPPADRTPAGRSALWLASTWALALLASTLIAVWSMGRVTKPLQRLAASVQAFGAGQLQERVAVETEDEVGTLAESFNRMAAQLQTKFEEVRTQGAFIEDILDSLPLGVVVLDRSLIVRKANPTFARFVHREQSKLEGRGLYEAAAGFAALRDIVEDVRRTRQPFVSYGLPIELVARASEQEEPTAFDVIAFPTSERSNERGDMMLILSDVTKRVRAEKLATRAFTSERKRAAELESVIRRMNEGVVIVDWRGRYRINPMAAQILAREPGEFRDGVDALIQDIGLRDLTTGRELQRNETPLGLALERGEHVSGAHFKIVLRDNSERVIELGVTPLVGENEQREGLVAVFRDITDEMQRHYDLVAAYERLREHDRLKSAFVATVSHELRTPLNVIIGLCQLLERDPQQPLTDEQFETVMRMERNSRSLLSMVNDLLDYSRLEAGRSALQLEQTAVSDLMSEILDEFRQEAEQKKIELTLSVTPEVGRVMLDRQKFAQAMNNLVGNAVKFTNEGAVRIEVSSVNEELWRLEVSDTGIGISPDDIAYIFDEFRQVDDKLTRAYGGVGLGLAITRKIVELLGGEIKVESHPNAGSRFRVTLPRVPPARTGTGSLVKAQAATASARLRVAL